MSPFYLKAIFEAILAARLLIELLPQTDIVEEAVDQLFTVEAILKALEVKEIFDESVIQEAMEGLLHNSSILIQKTLDLKYPSKECEKYKKYPSSNSHYLSETQEG